MTKIGLFKRCFFLGRALWLKGPHDKRKIKAVYQLLKTCGVTQAGVVQMNPQQFIDIFSSGFSREVFCQYQVFIVKNFEDLNEGGWARFAAALDLYRYLRFDLGIRLILMVNENEVICPRALLRVKDVSQPLLTDISQLFLAENDDEEFEKVSAD